VFLFGSLTVLRDLVNYGSWEVQWVKGKLVRIQEHGECSGFQEDHSADICISSKNFDVKEAEKWSKCPAN
jgi:hypothetical protein